MKTIQERPQTIKEMAGHRIILAEMRERSKNNTFENHMLFVGQSGSGKSTLALNLAKLINCKNPVEQEDGSREPCNECAACKDVIQQSYNRDVYYMDATYMGKEEVQRLHDKVLSRPMYDGNKVFIIDEAHLLNSKEARGGMLTLTEKKLENVYFILCTTDNSKFDSAFKSRFAQYFFKKVSMEDIGEYLVYELEKDMDKYEEEYLKTIVTDVLPLIAENANGSIRQAIQYLERVLATGLTDTEEIVKELGLVSEEQIYKMIDYLLLGNIEKFFTAFNYYEDKGYVFNYLTRILLNNYRYHLGDGKAITNNYIKEKTDRIFKDTPKQIQYLFVAFHRVLTQSGYRFNERLFEFEIVNYFNNIENSDTNSIPKMHKEDKKRRRKVVD